MLDHCPGCGSPLRRLEPGQTEFYRLPFAQAEWRLLGHRTEGRRCDACATLYLLPAGLPRREPCPRCQRPTLTFERAELVAPTLLDPGHETIRLSCACGYREVLQEARPVPRRCPGEGGLGAEFTRGTGFGLAW